MDKERLAKLIRGYTYAEAKAAIMENEGQEDATTAFRTVSNDYLTRLVNELEKLES